VHVAVVDGAALRRDFNHALLLPLRARHVLAVPEKLQVAQAPEHPQHPHQRHGGDNQQTFCLHLPALAPRMNRFVPALGIGRQAACWSGVGTIFLHSEFRSAIAPAG